MRLLVTGTGGQLARALAERTRPDLAVIRLGRPELDLRKAGDLAPRLSRLAPDVVVNAAAYTAVDKAEIWRDEAFAINAAGAGAVASAAQRLGIPVIQISTDYVFDGTCHRLLTEADPTGPIGAYGASKLAGEMAVAAATADHAILRTAWLYAPFGANFLRTMLRLAMTRREIAVVGDQFGTPTSAIAAAATVEAVARRLVDNSGDATLRGIFHMTASGGPVSWADFAAAIFAEAALHGGPSAAIVPIGTAQYPTPALRPAWSCLDGSKLARTYGLRLPHWRDSLSQVIARLSREGAWA